MEKPSGAIPYYLFFGVVLLYGILLREHAELQRQWLKKKIPVECQT